MGDVGDYWRDHREWKQSVRRHWHECPTCADRYGTGTKVAPGYKCRNCGWEAPGIKGEDVAKVRDEERIPKPTNRPHGKGLPCRLCGKRFKGTGSRNQHELDKHGKLVE